MATWHATRYWVGLLLTLGAIRLSGYPQLLLGITDLFHIQWSMIYRLYFDIYDTYTEQISWLIIYCSVFSIHTNQHINHHFSSISYYTKQILVLVDPPFTYIIIYLWWLNQHETTNQLTFAAPWGSRSSKAPESYATASAACEASEGCKAVFWSTHFDHIGVLVEFATPKKRNTNWVY